MDSYKHKFPNKFKALQIVKKGKAGGIYRKGSYWFVTSRRRRKIKCFIIMEGFRNERAINEV